MRIALVPVRSTPVPPNGATQPGHSIGARLTRGGGGGRFGGAPPPPPNRPPGRTSSVFGSLVTSGPAPPRRYHWNYRSPEDHGGRSSYPDSFGIYHTIELPFVFGTPPPFFPGGGRSHWNFTAPEVKLATSMQRLWGAHAATGSPNGAAAGPWPEYDTDTDANLVVNTDATIGTETGRRRKYCDFWAAARDLPIDGGFK